MAGSGGYGARRTAVPYSQVLLANWRVEYADVHRRFTSVSTNEERRQAAKRKLEERLKPSSAPHANAG